MNTPNAQMQAILDVLEEMNPLPIETLTAEQARLMPLPDRAAFVYYGQHITKRALSPMPPPVGRLEHRSIPGTEGDLIVRIYAPKKEVPEGGWPVVLYFHGGGWVIATLDTYDASCRALCLGADCMVISLHYRQAPEHPWPAAVNDAYTAYEWVLANVSALGGDPFRVAVAGESAGGNLAAIVAMMARDKGIPLPVHQLLVYPVTDLIKASTNPSALENATAKPLNRPMLSWFFDQYVPQEIPRDNPYISPCYAQTFAGLPPATIINAEIDPLRDEGLNYAAKLIDGGVMVTHRVYDSVTHEFFGMAGLVSEATEAVELACTNLKAAFKR